MTLESLIPFLQWIANHPTLSGFIVFIISLSESLAFVGLIVPGVILMTAIGSLIGAGRLPGVETMVWAMLGAIVGDGISYWLGYYYRDTISELWLFKKFSKWLEKGALFFERHGGKSIILGRFIGPIRPTIPVIAGIMGMDPKSFLFFNIVSAILWAPIYCLPGILIGLSLGHLSSTMASMMLSLVLGLLFVLWLFFYCLLQIIIYIERRLSIFFRKHGQLGVALLFLITIILFNFLVICIKADRGIVYWNDDIYQFLRALYTTAIADWLIVIFSFGAPIVIFSTMSIVGIWLFIHNRSMAICWLSTILLGTIIGQCYMFAVNSMRPDGLIQSLNSYSFPSINVLLATLTYGLLAVFIKQFLSVKYRWVIWAIFLFLVTTISFASVYLGLHWFTDTIGGILLGITCVTLSLLIYNRYFVKVSDVIFLKKFFIVFSIILLTAVTVYNIYTYSNHRNNWERQWSTQILNVNKWWTSQPIVESVYRSGVIKKRMLPLDVNWLGDLGSIAEALQKQGWNPLPELTWKSGIMMLSENASTNLIPVFPKFHRGRLPSLVFTKVLKDNSERLVLQLWLSDYITEDQIPLWVGTIRLETIKNNIAFINVKFYLENTEQKIGYKYIKSLLNSLSDKWQYKKTRSAKHHQVFLIAPKQD